MSVEVIDYTPIALEECKAILTKRGAIVPDVKFDIGTAFKEPEWRNQADGINETV